MIVQGVVTTRETTRETVSIDVNPRDVLKKLKYEWLNSISHSGHYINSDEVWEDWTYTGHGSGLYEHFGKATQEQISTFNAFALVDRVIKS